MSNKNKVVFITGGASGIGKLHATKLAKQGAKVAIIDLNEENLSITAKISENISPYYCDVTNLEMVQETVKKVEETLGEIDQLINCAAIMPGGLLASDKAGLYSKIMTINYCGMVNVCETIVTKFRDKKKGEVIIYGSTAGFSPTPRFGAYGASKAANNFYTETLIEENKNSNLRIVLVCPPAVDTPLLKQATDGPKALQNKMVKRFLMVEPEAVVLSAEKALRKGKKISYPGPAKMIRFLSRYFPTLTKKLG